jgi:hypothetical protein
MGATMEEDPSTEAGGEPVLESTEAADSTHSTEAPQSAGRSASIGTPMVEPHASVADVSPFGADSSSAVRTPDSFVYAIGRVEPRFPSLAVEKEFAQIASRDSTEGLTDRETLQKVVADRANRYLARQLCWVFLIENLENYVLIPNDPADYDLLVEAVRAEPRRDDLDVVIGTLGPLAPPGACGGLDVPVVVFDQLYSFDRDSLVSSVPRPDSIAQKGDARFRAAVGELADRIMQMTDNAGATDEHRALNYLAVRYPAIYAMAAEAHARNASPTGVDVRPSRISDVRTIVDVIFSQTHRETDVTEKSFVRVDVTEEFPFLVSKMAPFYELNYNRR